MPSSRCRISFSDPDGVVHALDVDAESLYEAVAIAVAQFRADDYLHAPEYAQIEGEHARGTVGRPN